MSTFPAIRAAYSEGHDSPALQIRPQGSLGGACSLPSAVWLKSPFCSSRPTTEATALPNCSWRKTLLWRPLRCASLPSPLHLLCFPNQPHLQPCWSLPDLRSFACISYAEPSSTVFTWLPVSDRNLVSSPIKSTCLLCLSRLTLDLPV